TLAQHVAFTNGTPERPALYLTTLAEPLGKLVTFLQELEFVDVGRIGTDVIYDSLDQELRERPGDLPAKLLALIQRHRPGVIIIDSFKAIGDIVSDLARWRGIVFEVAGVLA